jgi:hypothetical protein
MPNAGQEKHAGQERQDGEQLRAAIGKHVMDALGQPSDAYWVQVRPLWEGHYRVNVLAGADTTCARVAHSYFLVADGAGNILTTSPQLTRRY